MANSKWTILTILLLGNSALAEVVTTLDGASIEGTLLNISTEKVTIRTQAGEQAVPAADVRSIGFDKRTSADLMTTAGRHVIIASDGSRLAVSNEGLADGKVTGAADSAPKMSLPLEGVARILRPKAHETPADLERRRDALKVVRGEKDTLIVGAGEGQWVTMAGVVNSLDSTSVSVNYDGSDTTMEAPAVSVIEFAATGGAQAQKSVGQVLCVDGSQIAFVTLSVGEKDTTVESPALKKVVLDSSKIATIRLARGSAIYLSDLEPKAVKETPFFDESFSYRRDKSVAGEPLRIDGNNYEKGLGLHAKCELTYDLDGQFRGMTAVVGIDDTTPSGSAIVHLLGDGKELMKEIRIDGGPPRPIRVDLSGVKKLSVVADFAPGTFGAGARVDLCDPALSK